MINDYEDFRDRRTLFLWMFKQSNVDYPSENWDYKIYSTPRHPGSASQV